MAGEIDHAAGIAHLVVVPGVDLEQSSVCHQRGEPVDDGGTRVARIIDRDERTGLIAEDAGKLARSGLCEKRIDLLPCRFTWSSKTQSVSEALSTGARDGMAIELAVELGVDQCNGRCAAVVVG